MIGDKRYNIVNTVRKSFTEPNTRATATVVAETLSASYSYAQQNFRFLGSWSPSLSEGRIGRFVADSDIVEITFFDARVSLPDFVTHVRADLIYGVPPDLEYTIEHHIEVDEVGGTNNWSEQVNLDVQSEQNTPMLNFTSGLVTRAIEIEVGGVTSGYHDVRVWLQRGDSQDQLIFPHSCVITGEVYG